LGEKGLPFMLIFTKGDKQSTVKSDQNIAKFKRALLKWFEEVPQRFLTSAEDKVGLEPILQTIEDINAGFQHPIIEEEI
jgi:GTP-binding protein